jgi:hypothetical protein
MLEGDHTAGVLVLVWFAMGSWDVGGAVEG